jgi:hypothetical protein
MAIAHRHLVAALDLSAVPSDSGLPFAVQAFSGEPSGVQMLAYLAADFWPGERAG